MSTGYFFYGLVGDSREATARQGVTMRVTTAPHTSHCTKVTRPDKVCCHASSKRTLLYPSATSFLSPPWHWPCDSFTVLFRNCVPRVTIVGGLSACICPWGYGDGDGYGAIEVSVDVKSGRWWQLPICRGVLRFYTIVCSRREMPF